jgi:hypothetical protein
MEAHAFPWLRCWQLVTILVTIATEFVSEGWTATAAHSHQGRGVFGQRVAPHTNGTASPSSIKIAPTSRPLDFNVPQSLP